MRTVRPRPSSPSAVENVNDTNVVVISRAAPPAVYTSGRPFFSRVAVLFIVDVIFVWPARSSSRFTKTTSRRRRRCRRRRPSPSVVLLVVSTVLPGRSECGVRPQRPSSVSVDRRRPRRVGFAGPAGRVIINPAFVVRAADSVSRDFPREGTIFVCVTDDARNYRKPAVVSMFFQSV